RQGRRGGLPERVELCDVTGGPFTRPAPAPKHLQGGHQAAPALQSLSASKSSSATSTPSASATFLTFAGCAFGGLMPHARRVERDTPASAASCSRLHPRLCMSRRMWSLRILMVRDLNTHDVRFAIGDGRYCRMSLL